MICCDPAPSLQLVRNSKGNATIVINKNRPQEVAQAAEELQHYIEKISGAKLPIVNDLKLARGMNILIGNNESLNVDIKTENNDGFIIKTSKNTLFLCGKSEIGTLYAVYTFLEKYLGIRWFWPGELGEIVPKQSSIFVDDIDFIEEPDFKWRNRGPGGALWGAISGPTEMHARARLLGITAQHQDEVRRWEQRNKWGGMKIYGGHAMGEIYPPEKYAKTHPEFYALVDGKRAVPGPDYDYKHEGQICTTDPEVIKTAVDWAVEFFNQHPDYDGIHMTLNDGRGFCECDQCQKLDTGDFVTRPGIDLEEMKSKPVKYTVITDRVFTFMNNICEEIQKTHPGKYIVSMAYSRYIDPPKQIKIHPYVIPQYCLWSAYKHANTELKQKHEKIAAGWSEVSKATAIYEYYINGSWPGMHRLVVPNITESIKYLAGKGIRLYQMQSGDEFAINGINYYVAGKLLWDVSLNQEEILNEFYHMAFNTSGDIIKNYHHRLQEAWANATKYGQDVSCSLLSNTRLMELFTPDLLSACKEDLKRAKIETNDTAIKKRIEFYEKGLKFTDLTVTAVEKTRELETNGINIFPFDTAVKDIQNKEKDKVIKMIEKVLAAWEERDNYVENLKNDYVLAYFWIKYNDEHRSFNPTVNLKKLLKLLEYEI